jgi:replication fork clamp-binding protein CrfC
MEKKMLKKLSIQKIIKSTLCTHVDKKQQIDYEFVSYERRETKQSNLSLDIDNLCIENMQFNSTKINDLSCNMSDYSSFDETTIYEPNNKLTSSVRNDYHKINIHSPNISSISNNSNEIESTLSSSFDNLNDITMFKIFACCKTFYAKFDGQLSLQFSERVNILRSNRDFALVQKLDSNEIGYVPIENLCEINRFLSNIVHL